MDAARAAACEVEGNVAAHAAELAACQEDLIKLQTEAKAAQQAADQVWPPLHFCFTCMPHASPAYYNCMLRTLPEQCIQTIHMSAEVIYHSPCVTAAGATQTHLPASPSDCSLPNTNLQHYTQLYEVSLA